MVAADFGTNPSTVMGVNAMLISKKVTESVNQQIGNEFGASLQYTAIANYFSDEGLLELAKFFTRQADEERDHALKFNKFVLDSGGHVEIPAIAAPRCSFQSTLEALQLSLDWEHEVTRQINALYALATQEDDYVTQSFLSWFLKEQLEEVSTMDTLVKVAKRAGDNLLFLEEYVARHGAGLQEAEGTPADAGQG
jgi:ferritin